MRREVRSHISKKEHFDIFDTFEIDLQSGWIASQQGTPLLAHCCGGFICRVAGYFNSRIIEAMGCVGMSRSARCSLYERNIGAGPYHSERSFLSHGFPYHILPCCPPPIYQPRINFIIIPSLSIKLKENLLTVDSPCNDLMVFSNCGK